MDILSTAARALARPLCDHCLGRLYGKCGHGFTNDERGRAIRTMLAMTGRKSAATSETGTGTESECWVCEDLFDDLGLFLNLVDRKLAGLEFGNYLVGCRPEPELIEREELLWAELGLTHAEPFKAEFNREFGKLLGEHYGCDVEFDRPDVAVIIDMMYNTVSTQIAPVFIYGRYQKLARGIPQTRWPCRKCHGSGCDRCDGTGKMYQESVEELVGAVLAEATGASNFKLHGMGREDIDARMLGTGRPFVIECSEPRVRTLDLAGLETAVNERYEGKVAVCDLRPSTRDEVVAIKASRSEKTYRVHVTFDGVVPHEKLKKAGHALRLATIRQQTPRRVAHRRADRCRKRIVKEFKIDSHTDTTADLEIRGESGLYIKELLHGDEGRTDPSLAAELGCGVTIQTLDVIAVHDQDESTSDRVGC